MKRLLFIIICLPFVGCDNKPNQRQRVSTVLVRDVQGRCIELDGEGKYNEINVVPDAWCAHFERHAVER